MDHIFRARWVRRHILQDVAYNSANARVKRTVESSESGTLTVSLASAGGDLRKYPTQHKLPSNQLQVRRILAE